jgi:Mannosyltransferase (PIG-V)
VTGGVARPAGSPLSRWLSPAQRLALSDVSTAFWVSRALIWVAGAGLAALIGVHALQGPQLDPLSETAPFQSDLANVLVAPGARFDSSWLLAISNSGYGADGSAAFFPLYPALVALLGVVLRSTIVAGIVLSSACTIGGLYLLHRLTALDHGRDTARRTVWIVACFPMAFAFSAVYTEGLFLLLSVGAFYAARLGRWGTAAAVGLLAAATRSAGVLLILPLLLVYFYGPRADREPDFDAGGLRPRYRWRAEVAWLAAIPLGLLAFLAYLGIAIGDPLATFGAQADWHRILAPLGGLVMGVISGVQGLVALVSGHGSTAASSVTDGRALAGLNVILLGVLVLAGWLIRETARRLPVAYTAYAISSVALPLSTPAVGQPLLSLPRFMMVIFPFWIAVALWSGERAASRRVIGGSSVLLVACTALFVAWISAP